MMFVQPERRRWLFAAIAGSVVVLIAGLVLLLSQVRISSPLGGSPAPGSGDPGNARLHELRNDPVFVGLPGGAHVSGPIVQTLARYRPPGFESGGWETPTVALTFTDEQPAATVYQFYAFQAAAAGWSASHDGQPGSVDRWVKMYPDHATAWLGLFTLEQTLRGYTYELAGGISIIE